MKCSLFIFGIKFVRYPASITYLCHVCLITTFKILCIENQQIYWISEFSYSLILLLASKIPYRSGPTVHKRVAWLQVFSNLTACYALANMCVMNMHSFSSMSTHACGLFNTIFRSRAASRSRHSLLVFNTIVAHI